MKTVELFEKFTDYEFERKSFEIARILAGVLAVFTLFVFIINLGILPDNPILTFIGSSSRLAYYPFCICISFLLLTSDNAKLNKISYLFLFVAGAIVLCAFLSFFGLFGVDKWLQFSCETKLFGLYQMTIMFFIIMCVATEKFESIAQDLALINVLIGYSGLFYYLGTVQIYTTALHYLVFHILCSSIFLLMPTKDGIFKALTIKSATSRQSLKLVRYTVIGISVVYILVEMFSNNIISSTGSISLVITILSLSFIICLILFYSRKWVIQDLERQILEDNALELQETIKNVQSISKIALVSGEKNKFKWTSEIFEILEIDPIEEPMEEDLLFKYATDESKELAYADYKKNFRES